MRKIFNGAGLQSILLLLAFFTFPSLQAQTPNNNIEVAKMQWQSKQVVPPSPDAAELGKYGNVPVSLYTGTPSVSIPFFELKGSSLSVPVSISYNASGFKPEDAAPWVGSGWSLNAGGVITRAVRGNPDNASNYFGVTNLLNPPSELDLDAFHYYVKDIQDGTKETNPDVYYYNFNGHSGKFVVRPDYTVVKSSKDLTKIDACVGTCLDRFVIVDEQGITYKFEAQETTMMIPYDAEGQPGQAYHFVSAWYLTEMIAADGVNSVTFEYHSTFNSQPVHQNMVANQSISFSYGFKNYPSCGSYPYDGGNIFTSFPPHTSIKREFLKKITLKKGNEIIAYVDVISTTGQRLDSDFTEDRLVNSVKLFSKRNGTDYLVSQFNFTYGYFTNLQNVINKRRLRLESVQQVATNGMTTSPPPYFFSYNNNFSLPERFSFSLDHWGFYNAQPNNSLVPNFWFQGIPSFPARNVGGGANREATLEGSSATLLTKIDYPTGGYTTFEYELNQAKVNNVFKNVGGVRIKTMVDYSHVNKAAIVKNYTYLLDDLSSSGEIGLWPEYKTNSSFHHYLIPTLTGGQGSPVDCEAVREYVEYDLNTISMSANSIFGLGSFQGSHIGYSQVTESQMDLATNQSLGKTVYKYNVGSYFEHNEDIRSGDLLQQTVYRNDGKILQQTTSTYQYTVDYDIIARIPKANAYQTNKAFYCKISTHNYFNFGEWESPHASCINYGINMPTTSYLESYATFIQNKQLTHQVHKIYDQLTNNYLTTTKNFTYNTEHNYPIAIEEISNNGGKVKTEIKYVKDYAGNSSNATTGTFAYNVRLMREKNIVSLPIEKLQSRQDANGNNTRYISGQLSDYILGNLSRMYFLEARPLLTSVTPSTIATNTLNYDGNYRLAATMSYDNSMNLIQQAKTDDVFESYIWGYNGQYPVAKIMGKTQGDAISQSSVDVNIINNPSSDQALRTELNKLRNLSDVLVITYTYAPLVGVTSETAPNGRTTYYEYDGLNRLALVKDHDGKIIKKLCYYYHGQPAEDCGVGDSNAQWQATGVVQCKPCPANANYTTNIQQQQQKDNNSYSSTYNQTRWVDIGANGACASSADWQYTTTAIRCKNYNGYTGEQEREQKDMNPCSSTANQTRWVVVGTDCVTCPKSQNWQSTGSYRCMLDGNGQNTGYREREERNMESCSGGYYTTRWVFHGYNSGACPAPPSCNYYTCQINGPEYRCVYGSCEYGYKVYTGSYYDYSMGQYYCTYHYEWTDGTWSLDYYEYSSFSCMPSED